MGKGKPKSLKRDFLMEQWGVSTLDELAKKLKQQEKEQITQENDNIDERTINLYMQLDAEDIDYLIQKLQSEKF